MTHTQLVRRVIKPIVFAACLTPFVLLLVNGIRGELGVNPVETITNTTGIWTLRFIAISLAITPLRWLSGWNPLIRLRRPVGLFAFFYAVLHFMTYFVLDHSLMFEGLWEDVVKRPYITVGFTAFLLMIPLAVTSTQGWIRRLGGKRWSLVHRLVYITALLGVVHYWWKVKLDTSSPLLYAVLVAALLAFRVWRSIASRQAASSTRTPRQVLET